jgi:sarcosine oxidase
MAVKTCDVAVIGLGIMGSAALYYLARHGVDVLGFDPLRPGETRGSSHGSSRIYRRFNFENPAYTPLSDLAARNWKELEHEAGEKILLPSRLVEAGVPGSALVGASRAAAGRAADRTCGADINAMFPAFRLPRDWDAAVQDTGGILRADRALYHFRRLAGERIMHQAVRFEAGPAQIEITSADGTSYRANKVIVATGPWVVEQVPQLADYITLTRQPVGWFEPREPAKVGYEALPIFILDTPSGIIYGFPDFEGQGVKAAEHDHGRRLDHADEARQDATGEDLRRVGEALSQYIPAAAGALIRTEICVYTNTAPGDADGSPAEEFILDRLPNDPRVIVASPCSGHGFKFASAIGEILATMAMRDVDSGYPEFGLKRFGKFKLSKNRREIRYRISRP